MAIFRKGNTIPWSWLTVEFWVVESPRKHCCQVGTGAQQMSMHARVCVCVVCVTVCGIDWQSLAGGCLHGRHIHIAAAAAAVFSCQSIARRPARASCEWPSSTPSMPSPHRHGARRRIYYADATLWPRRSRSAQQSCARYTETGFWPARQTPLTPRNCCACSCIGLAYKCRHGGIVSVRTSLTAGGRPARWVVRRCVR